MPLSETTGSTVSQHIPEGLLYRSLKKTEGFGGDSFKSESVKSSFPASKCLFYRQSTVSSIPIQERVCFRKYRAVKRYSLQLPLFLQ